VTVQKTVELAGTGSSVEEAVQEALDRAESTLEGITSFEVREISGTVEDGRTVFRVELRVWFTLLERMHG
jgi:flavin-binding protein dodecin